MLSFLGEAQIPECPMGLQFRGNGAETSLLVSAAYGQLIVLDVPSLRETQFIKTGLQSIGALDIHPQDSSILAVVGCGGVQICDLDIGDVVYPPMMAWQHLNAIVWVGHDFEAICGGSDEQLTQFDFKTGHSGFFAKSWLGTGDLRFSPNREYLMFTLHSDAGMALEILRNAGEWEREVFYTLNYQDVTANWAPDGKKYAVAHKYLCMLDFPSHEKRWAFEENVGLVDEMVEEDWEAKCSWSRLCFTPDSQQLFAVTPGGVLGCWDVLTGEMIFRWFDDMRFSKILAINADGTLLAVGSGADRKIQVLAIDRNS